MGNFLLAGETPRMLQIPRKKKICGHKIYYVIRVLEQQGVYQTESMVVSDVTQLFYKVASWFVIHPFCFFIDVRNS